MPLSNLWRGLFPPRRRGFTIDITLAELVGFLPDQYQIINGLCDDEIAFLMFHKANPDVYANWINVTKSAIEQGIDKDIVSYGIGTYGVVMVTHVGYYTRMMEHSGPKVPENFYCHHLLTSYPTD